MNDRVEIREAIQAADQALYHLDQADRALSSAGNWGLVDLFGGLVSTFMKHGKLERAQEQIERARDALRAFARELRDVDGLIEVNINVGDFLGFADFFFDGLIADYMVQKRIRQAKAQIQEAVRRVRYLRDQLSKL